jgi:hypothetical protein
VGCDDLTESVVDLAVTYKDDGEEIALERGLGTSDAEYESDKTLRLPTSV